MRMFSFVNSRRIFSLSVTIFLFFMLTGFFSCHRSRQAIKIPNPMAVSSSEECLDVIGKTFAVPADADDVSWFSISGSLYQLSFNWRGIACTARMEKTSCAEDISGIYYSWERITKENAGPYPGETKYVTVEDGNILAVCNFYDDDGISCSLSMNVPGLGPGDTDDIRKLLINFAEDIWGLPPND
ncbi:MAG: hypothetical protein IJL70_09150 [Treponema sp.]|nr:hypothetical protein [Treponema sp.]